MKKSGAVMALLTPESQGWNVHLEGEKVPGSKTLPEAVASLPALASIHLALPGSFVLLERLTLPSIDSLELAGMVELQLEKTLPYPIEEASSCFEIISQSENESTVLSVAANCAQLEELCAPFRSVGRLPQRISLYAVQVASSCPHDEVVLCLWAEHGQIELAIAERGKLGFVQSLAESDPLQVQEALPQILLSAEMEGVSTNFSRIRLEQGCAQLQEVLAGAFTQPIELCSFDGGVEGSGNLAPAAWKSVALQMEKSDRLRQRLQMAAVVYLILIAGAFLYLAWIKSQVRKLDVELAQAQPLVEFVQSRQSQWNALAPAVEPTRSTIEVLFLVYKSRPSEEVKITTFEHNPVQFRVEGEAPSANQAIEFVEKLRAESGLSDFRIESPPPSILPSGAAHFNIFGKL